MTRFVQQKCSIYNIVRFCGFLSKCVNIAQYDSGLLLLFVTKYRHYGILLVL